MKTEPITPARIEFGQVPFAPHCDGLYHRPMDALEQARWVFLQGNDLPRRWSGRPRFTILETGFGLGNNFLATWDAWRADPQRCARLFFVSIERHPPLAADLARGHANSPLRGLADQLHAAWPPLTPNLHVLDFEGGSVQLLLGLGDVAELLPQLRAEPDAFFLDGFSPTCGPQMWQPRVLKALGRMAAADATLAAWSVASELRDGLASAGFDVEPATGRGGRRKVTLARHAPRFVRPARPRLAVAGKHAVVVGAGIAGAAAARALLAAGLQVTVIDRRATPAAETSGNPAGLFHGTVHPDDGPHARLFRAAALTAQRDYGCAGGALRLGEALPAMQALLLRQGLPQSYVQALDAAAASALAGVPLASPAWFYYPGGGWLAAPEWIGQQLAQPGLRWVGNTAVAGLQRDAQGWLLYDAAGRTISSAAIVVLANAAGAAPLLAPLGHAAWPLAHSRGQVTLVEAGAQRLGLGSRLRIPVAGDGYAIPLADGRLLCGATREDGEPRDGDIRALSEADHRHNTDRLQRLTGLKAADDDPATWSGRAGWRLQTPDRLPIAGAMPLAQMPRGQRLDQARLLPRDSGLFVLTALGARGLTLAPLLGRLVAAQATGAPWPLEQDLADVIDPARWRVQAARRTAGSKESPA